MKTKKRISRNRENTIRAVKNGCFRKNSARLLVAGILSLVAGVLNASSAKLVVDAPLKSNPDFSATNILNLKKNESVSILKRERGWYEVSTSNKQTGWLTLLQVRYDKAPNASSPSDLARFIGLRKGHSNVTATTGVRGIGEKDIKNAKADFNALVIMEQYKSSPQEAKAFAKSAALKPQSIKYLEKEKE